MRCGWANDCVRDHGLEGFCVMFYDDRLAAKSCKLSYSSVYVIYEQFPRYIRKKLASC